MTITVSKASINLNWLIDQVEISHQPVIIRGKRMNAVLISEEDWSSIQQTLYLLHTQDSIKRAMDEPLTNCGTLLECT